MDGIKTSIGDVKTSVDSKFNSYSVVTTGLGKKLDFKVSQLQEALQGQVTALTSQKEIEAANAAKVKSEIDALKASIDAT